MEDTNPTVYPLAKLVYIENIKFGLRVIIDDFVFIVAKLPVYLGDFTHIASYTSITGGGVFSLGDYSTLSSGVRILTGTEDIDTPGLLGSAIPEGYRKPLRSEVHIGRHCMVGANSVVLPGATIPDGVVIGAMSLVRENSKLSPWSIWAGNPLRHFRDRPRDKILAMTEALEREVDRGTRWRIED